MATASTAMAQVPDGVTIDPINNDVSSKPATTPIWDLGGAQLLIGNTGKGELTIGAGGSVSNDNGFIAVEAGSEGKVTVEGGSWINDGELDVGTKGNAEMNIGANGSVSNHFGIVGSEGTATGKVTVAGQGASWTNTSLYIGYDGKGTLDIGAGGGVISTVGALGANAGAEGKATVAGAGAVWTNSVRLYVGWDGIGDLTIRDGGRIAIDAGHGELLLGESSTANGTLTIGAPTGSTPAAAGTLTAGQISFGDGIATLVFNHSDPGYVFTPNLVSTGPGTHTIEHIAGTTLLTGDGSGFTGSTTVSGGTLLVGNAASNTVLGGTIWVQTNGTLGGSGTVGTTVVDGTLSAGNSPGTLTVAGNLTLNAGSTSVFELGTPGVVGDASNDLVKVTNNLSLGGTLQTPGAVSGYYRLFDVGGAVSGAFATVPTGATVNVDIPHQVNLLLRQGGQLVQFWDGVDTAGNGAVDGGTGTWNAANTNWTGAPGQAGINDHWRGEVGVFAGAAGTVTTAGPLAFQGLQFTTDGYRLQGDALTMTGNPQGNAAASFINVDGGVTATIAASLTGTGIGLDKLGGGTLVLEGANTYTGSTTITAGTLQLGNGGASGSIVGNVANSGVFAINRTDTFTFAGSISGTGAFEQRGSGVSIFTGTNIYTGTTTVAAGTLQAGVANVFASGSAHEVAAGATLDLGGFDQEVRALSGSGQVLLGAGTLTTGGVDASSSFSGTISGSGGIAKIGTGTFTLAGTSSYTGLTQVFSGGMLKAGAANAFAAQSTHEVNFGATLDLDGYNQTIGALIGGGTVKLGSAVLTTGGNNASTAFNGAIEGSGSLVKVGSNFFGLTTAGSWSGGLVARDGQVGLGHDQALGTGTLTLDGGVAQAMAPGIAIANAITVTGNDGGIDNAGYTMALRGTIDGPGAIRFTDAGNLVTPGIAGRTIVSGNNSAWSGGAEIINAGVIVTHNNALGTGTIELDYGGLIAGAANLTFANPIALHPTPDGNVIDNGGYRFTLAGPLGNETPGAPGNVVFGGLGTTVLEGTSSYTGFTRVHSGTLSVNGSIASSSLTTVSAGATLGGNGTVGDTLIDGGMLSPGNSTGVLTVAGNLVMTAASTYLVEVSSNNAALTHVTGTATLNGATVAAQYAPGSYVEKRYNILTADGGLNGTTFSGPVNTNLPSNFKTALAYDGSNAYLVLALDYTPPPAPNFGNGLNHNQQAVATTLTNFFNTTGGIPLAFGALSPQGLTQVSGELATGTQQATFDAMNLFLGLLTDPFVAGRGGGITSSNGAQSFAAEDHEALSYTSRSNGRSAPERDAYDAMSRKAPRLAPSFEQRWSLWAAGYGGSQTTSGNSVVGSNTATGSIYGTAVGADYRISPDTLAGFAMAGGATGFRIANGLGSGRSDLFQAGAFVRHHIGAAYLTGALAYGWQDVTTDRTVTASGVERLRANFNANAFSGRLEGGYRITTPWIGLTPYVAAQFTTYDLPAYAEQASVGSLFALNYASKEVTASRSELGLRTDKSFALNDAIMTLRSRAAWAHNFDTDRSIAATFQSLPGASFVVNGAAQAVNTALITAAAEVKWMNGFALAATFEGEFSDTTSAYAGKGVVRYAW